MRIQLLLCGKTREPYVLEGMKKYEKRIRRYADFRLYTLPDIRATASWTQASIMEAEGKKMLKALNERDFLVLLDERGREMDSIAFAAYLEKRQMEPARMVFAIGGAYGFSPEMYQRANQQLSLSRMTFSHQLVRLVFMEQLYRAFTLIHGEPYHHGRN